MGPFQILAQINPITFLLKLPDGMKIHPASFLQLFHENLSSGRILPPCPPLEKQGKNLWLKKIFITRSSGTNDSIWFNGKYMGQQKNLWNLRKIFMPLYYQEKSTRGFLTNLALKHPGDILEGGEYCQDQDLNPAVSCWATWDAGLSCTLFGQHRTPCSYHKFPIYLMPLHFLFAILLCSLHFAP